MTDLAIQVRENVRRKARRDHAAGLPRDAHNLNPSAALDDYQDEWDWCEKQKRQALVVLEEVSPP